MQNTTKLTILEILLMILASFLGGAIFGFFLDSYRKKIVNSGYAKTRAQREAQDFHDDLAMEMGELR